MPNLRRIVSRLTSPDRWLGRSLMRARMAVQSAPLRLRSNDPDTREFLRLCSEIVPKYSMVSLDRLHSLYQKSLDLARRGVPGAIVECGTWNGGAAAIMAAASIRGGVERDVWLFDSFEGLPVPTPEDPPEVHDSYFAGWCCGSPELAREVVRRSGVPDERIHIVKGWFEHTLPKTSVSPIALLHIDSDWYASVRLCLETFFDAVSHEGVIVFDDYEVWAGCKKAADEFMAARGISTKLLPSGRIAAYYVVDRSAGTALSQDRHREDPKQVPVP